MNDTVTKLMELAADWAQETKDFGHMEHSPARQTLEAELTRMFTPLSDEHVTKFLRDECIYASDDICGWSFGQGVKWAEQKHGITGEDK